MGRPPLDEWKRQRAEVARRVGMHRGVKGSTVPRLDVPGGAELAQALTEFWAMPTAPWVFRGIERPPVGSVENDRDAWRTWGLKASELDTAGVREVPEFPVGDYIKDPGEVPPLVQDTAEAAKGVAEWIEKNLGKLAAGAAVVAGVSGLWYLAPWLLSWRRSKASASAKRRAPRPTRSDAAPSS